MEEKKNVSSEIRLYKAYVLERLYEDEPNPKKVLADKREETWVNYCMSILRINDLVYIYYLTKDIETKFGNVYELYQEIPNQF